MNDEAKNKVIERMAELDPNLAAKFVQKEEKAKPVDFLSSFMAAIKGDKGDTPEYKKDYLTEEELSQIKKEITPVKGQHYFTLSEIQDFLNEVTPRKGEHYFDGAKGEPGKDGYTPVKGVDYFDGKPGEKGDKGDPGKDGKDATVEDVVKALRNLKGNDRLDITHLRNGEQIAMALGKLQKLDMSDLRWHGGGLVTIQNAGTQVTNKATVLNFTGTGISSITELNGVVTVNISGGSGGGITSINADTTAAQVLDVGTAGTDFAISDNGTGTHTFNLPTASATKRGALSSADWTTFNNKFTLPSLTSGSVLFSNGTTIAQDNSNFFWDDANNRLGVGTTNPQNTLVVRSASPTISTEVTGFSHSFASTVYSRPNQAGAMSYWSGTNGGVLFTGIGSGVPSLAFMGAQDTTTPTVSPVTFTAMKRSGTDTAALGSTDKAFSFYNGTSSWTNGTELITILGGGNVGIGTTTPGYKLEVSGTSGTLAKITGTNTANPVYGFVSSNGSNGLYFGQEGSVAGSFFTSTVANASALGTSNATALQFATNNTVRTTIDSSGNVGIGTTGPAAKLDVSGSILGQRLVEANTAGSGSPNIITAGESRTLYTNEGATALNYHTLPTAAAGLTYTFYVQDADGIRVTANTGDVININGVASSTAGYCQSTSVGSSVTLTAINATDWVATSVVGTWTLA